jgi:hypothetical protein
VKHGHRPANCGRNHASEGINTPPGTTRVYAKTTKAQRIQAHESLFDGEDEN